MTTPGLLKASLAKRLPRIVAGRSAIGFYFRKDMDAITQAIEPHKTDTGRMMISSPALTALDLLRYPHAAGGLSHIATVLKDLGERLDPAKLAVLAPAFERTVVQRLGHLLDWLGFAAAAEALHGTLGARALLPPPAAAALTEEARREAFVSVFTRFIEPLPGEPWARSAEMIARYGLPLETPAVLPHSTKGAKWSTS